MISAIAVVRLVGTAFLFPVIPAILVVHAVSGPEAKMKETAAAAAIKNEFSDRQF